ERRAERFEAAGVLIGRGVVAAADPGALDGARRWRRAVEPQHPKLHLFARIGVGRALLNRQHAQRLKLADRLELLTATDQQDRTDEGRPFQNAPRMPRLGKIGRPSTYCRRVKL